MNGPEPYCGITFSHCRGSVAAWDAEEEGTAGLRISKMFINLSKKGPLIRALNKRDLNW